MPTLYYELERDIGFDDSDYLGVAVHFSSICTVKACAASFTDPGWPAEYEHTLKSMKIVPNGASHAPLSEAERASIVAWFATQGAECDELAEAEGDDFGDRADYEYERWRDRQMEREWDGADRRAA